MTEGEKIKLEYFDDFEIKIRETPERIIAELRFGITLIDAFYNFKTVEEARKYLIGMIEDICNETLMEIKNQKNKEIKENE